MIPVLPVAEVRAAIAAEDWDLASALLNDHGNAVLHALASVDFSRTPHAPWQELLDAQQALTDADTQLEAVLSHQAAWQRERDHERQRKEEAAMDDVAARLWKENRR